ncbi:MAG: DoxX family protein [Candidatus Dormibacteraeota bacterium]|nr:DoxX family protein [Candidatus Dormibacteraeota bacterium]
MDAALLILRLVVGVYLFAHGAMKLWGWFGGGGLEGTTGFMRRQGFRPAGFWALAAGLSEAGGGALLALGLLSPLGSLGVIAAMLVAAFTAHWGKGAFAMRGGPELPATNVAVAAALALSGPGRYSLDHLVGLRLPEPALGLALLVLTLAGVAVAMLTRRAEAVPARAAETS